MKRSCMRRYLHILSATFLAVGQIMQIATWKSYSEEKWVVGFFTSLAGFKLAPEQTYPGKVYGIENIENEDFNLK